LANLVDGREAGFNQSRKNSKVVQGKNFRGVPYRAVKAIYSAILSTFWASSAEREKAGYISVKEKITHLARDI
jgi:hypothetical protein